MDTPSRKALMVRANTFLGRSTSSDSMGEILRLLESVRNRSHPDQFMDEQAKETAKLRFQEAQSLIDELTPVAELHLAQMPPAGLLSLTQNDSKLLHLLDLDEARLEMEQLKLKLIESEGSVSTLTKELADLKASVRESELDDIKKLYAPSTSKLILGSILAASLALLTLVERIALELDRISPNLPPLIRWILVSFCLVALLGIPVQLIRDSEFRHMKGEVCTASFAQSFREEVMAPPPNRYSAPTFDDWQVRDYVERHFTEPRSQEVKDVEGIKEPDGPILIARPSKARIALRRLLGLDRAETYEHLKQAFVNWLIHWQYVRSVKVSNLTHRFETRVDH